LKRTLALIGIGYWGKNLARNFNDLGALHTICDRQHEQLDKFKENYPEVEFVSDFRPLLQNPEIRQVAIAAPAAQHFKLAREALLADKDVFVEKPITMKSDEALELVHLAENKNRVLMVGHLLHYHPCVEKMKQVIQSGRVGKLHSITSHRMNLGAYRTEENALWNFAPHDVSVILSLVGGLEPEQVICTGGSYVTPGVEDQMVTLLQFPGNLHAHILSSWIHPFKEQKLSVIGSKGMLVFDDTKPWGEKLTLQEGHIEWIDQKPLAVQKEVQNIDPEQAEPLKRECQHFLDCSINGTRPLTDGREGLLVTEVLEAADKSLKLGGVRCTTKHSNYFAHPTAEVAESAHIGEGTQIWHYSHIMSGARIGPNSKFGQNVFVASDVNIGKNCKIQNNVSIYSGVTLEDHVFLGPSMVFTNITNPRSEVVRRGHYLKTMVRLGASIGANATILSGIEIGEYAFIGAGSVVTKDVKPFALMLGNPARQVGWMSRYGKKLDLPLVAPNSETLLATCPQSKEKYQLVGDQLTLCSEARAQAATPTYVG